ncbi:DUF4012 domain-containing protein [Collinsella tanakaei]|nr:DUF4012 domain-containing protein [Collinsella tanakaei]
MTKTTWKRLRVEDGEPLPGLPLILESHHELRPPRRCRRVGRIVAAATVAIILVLGVRGALFVRSALTVRGCACDAVGLISSMGDALSGGSVSLADAAEQLDGICSDIHAETDFLLWAAATLLPFVGGDVHAACEVVATVSDASSGMLVPVAQSLAVQSDGLFIEGGVDVAAVQSVVDALAGGAEAAASVNARVRGLAKQAIPQVAEAVEAVQGGARRGRRRGVGLRVAVARAGRSARRRGLRGHIVVAENNAELRANGGIGAHTGLLTVENGALAMGDFTGGIEISDEQKLPVTDEEWSLFNKTMGHMGMFSSEAVLAPDFPRMASIISQIFQTRFGERVDGAIAVDPVFLQYLMAARSARAYSSTTGRLSTAPTLRRSSSMTCAGTTRRTRPTRSSRQSPARRSTSSCPGCATRGLVPLASAFVRGVSEGLLIAWMVGASERGATEAFGVSASLPDADDLTSALQTDVYLNNMVFSKMDWYVDFDVETLEPTALADGSREYRVTVDIANTITDQEFASLPDYVSVYLIKEDGSIELVPLECYIVCLYAPVGGSISDVEVTGDGGMTMSGGTPTGSRSSTARSTSTPRRAASPPIRSWCPPRRRATSSCASLRPVRRPTRRVRSAVEQEPCRQDPSGPFGYTAELCRFLETADKRGNTREVRFPKHVFELLRVAILQRLFISAFSL